MYSPQETAQIQLARRKSLDGTITKEELREVYELMRKNRTGAAVASAERKTRSAKPNSDALLQELEGL